MTRWFKRVAVLAAWLGLGSMTLAQNVFPSPVGATRIPEPLAYTPDEPPPTNLVPGPLNPYMAPAGPPPSLNLPENHTGAFQLDNLPPEEAIYVTAGGMALKRNTLRGRSIAFLDDQNAALDTGGSPAGTLRTLLNLNQIGMEMSGGVRASLGYLYANESFELNGFYMPYNSSSAEVIDQGRIHVPFGPDNAFPIGFEGNNNLWRQADFVRAEYTGGLASAEGNYRWWNPGFNEFECIVGVRYFYSQERLDLYTDDDFFVRGNNGLSDPARAATYSTNVRNNYLGFQFGGEYGLPVPIDYFQSCVWMLGMFKGSLGMNWIERNWTLTRGDGFAGFSNTQNSFGFASVNEVAGCLDIHLLDRLRIRGGYTLIWAAGFATPGREIDFDFNTQGQRNPSTGSMLWHGPIAELQLLY